ncbi:S8 family serine peptidase [Actinoplanes hulinensis]|uniref:S8 family serine peptidase n=1 Tax=Actinoplanes hulinensis TaxID=1144547 RepID=A0ABS7B5L6_9ACTN|nr:S8 family serine peptidase [Actinoplanes hulinensis]MBW6436334.1 S8 family serine peptidase [Actinoplanes hulinensis]
MLSTSHRLLGAVLAALVTLPVVPASAVPASAAPVDRCAQPEDIPAETPWPRAMLALDTVRPFTRGGGTTVALLSTGVHAAHPQLRGRVLPGFDAVSGRGPADTDCTGTGTQIAGVIAAQGSTGNGVVGVAPDTRIQPVRVVPDIPFGAVAQPAALTRGITWATDNGADVIVVATPLHTGDASLSRAVAAAVARGIVVVAAAGDLEASGGRSVPSFPAAYPDVLGVGAIGPDGGIWRNSPGGDFVDLVAPGVAVPTLQRGTGLVQVDGTAVAAGFVAGTVALARAKRGNLLTSEITRSLIAAASPTPAGPQYGAGVVNPYAALTEQVVAPSHRALPAVQPASPPETAAERRRRDLALLGAGLVLILVVGVLLATAALRRRGWRPGLAAPLPRPEEPVEPGPPVMLLDDLADSRQS